MIEKIKSWVYSDKFSRFFESGENIGMVDMSLNLMAVIVFGLFFNVFCLTNTNLLEPIIQITILSVFLLLTYKFLYLINYFRGGYFYAIIFIFIGIVFKISILDTIGIIIYCVGMLINFIKSFEREK